ncbi:MAG: hypothetical protein AAF724_08845 [Pseudomonadota bacterium]
MLDWLEDDAVIVGTDRSQHRNDADAEPGVYHGRRRLGQLDLRSDINADIQSFERCLDELKRKIVAAKGSKKTRW